MISDEKEDEKKPSKSDKVGQVAVFCALLFFKRQFWLSEQIPIIPIGNQKRFRPLGICLKFNYELIRKIQLFFFFLELQKIQLEHYSQELTSYHIYIIYTHTHTHINIYIHIKGVTS